MSDAMKIAAVSSIDKGTDYKNVLSNFDQLLLCALFKNIWYYLKSKLTPQYDKVFFLYLLAYQKKYDTQLAPIWEHLNNNYVLGRVSMDLSKLFDCIHHDLLIAKCAASGFDKI